MKKLKKQIEKEEVKKEKPIKPVKKAKLCNGIETPNNGVIKENKSGIAPDLYCDCCGAALKIVKTSAYALNNDCNEFPNHSNVK